MSVIEIHVFQLTGNDALKYMRKEIIKNRRRRLLFRLIKENRRLRKQIKGNE